MINCAKNKRNKDKPVCTIGFNVIFDKLINNGYSLNNTYNCITLRLKLQFFMSNPVMFSWFSILAYFSKHPSTSCQGDFYADGTLLDIIKTLMMVDGDDHMFGVTPRKILFISLEGATEQVISKQNYNIVFSGKDDTVTTNSLFVTGRKKIYTDTETFSNLKRNIMRLQKLVLIN